MILKYGILNCYSFNLHNNIAQFCDDTCSQMKVGTFSQKCVLSVITGSSMPPKSTDGEFDSLNICLIGKKGKTHSYVSR